MKPLIVIASLMLTLLAPWVVRAQGTVRYVAPDAACNGAMPCYSSVQAALTAAASGDEIRVAAGTYTGSSTHSKPSGYPAGITVSKVKQLVYVDKAVTIRGGYATSNWSVSDPAVNVTTLNAENSARVLFIVGSISPVIENLRLINGNASGQHGVTYSIWYADAGGAVYVLNASPTIRRCELDGHAAGVGAIVHLKASSALITGSTLSHGTATYYAGAVSFDTSPATLSQNIISANTAQQQYGGALSLVSSAATLGGNTFSGNSAKMAGGAMHLYQSAATINDNTFTGNWSSSAGGGAISLDQSGATLTNNLIQQNTAYTAGGAFFAMNSHPVTLNANTILTNTATTETSGALYMDSSTFNLTRNLIADNSANQAAGGLRVKNTTLTLDGDRIIGNHAGGAGGGIHANTNGSITGRNVVIANNTTGVTGSGLYVDTTALKLTHATLANNAGGDGSGAQLVGTTGYFTNSIVAHQAIGLRVEAGATANVNGALNWGNTFNTDGAGTLNQANLSSGDPAFVDAAQGDYHLQSTSAALDAGQWAGINNDVDNAARPLSAAGLDAPDLGADEFTATRSVLRPIGASVTFGAAGVRLTFADSGGLTSISADVQPDHFPTHRPDDPVVKRTISITPSHAAAVNATLAVQYAESEVPIGVEENALGLYRWTGSGWQSYPSNVDPINHIVTAANVNGFSPWVIAAEAPTAVCVTQLTAASEPSRSWWLAGLVAATGGLAATKFKRRTTRLRPR